MDGFLLSLLAVALAGLGARDQMTIAQLVVAQGSRPAVLAIGIGLCVITAALAGWASQAITPMLNANARLFLAALALGFAGLESLLFSPGKKPEEPTRSLAALAVVLAAHQLTDAARFLIFAIALASNAPLAAVIGGAAGGAILIGAAWASPEIFTWQRLRLIRRGIGAVLLVIGLLLGLSATGF